jgi:hypothetical protein
MMFAVLKSKESAQMKIIDRYFYYLNIKTYIRVRKQ